MKIMKRFLDCTASDFGNMKKKELLEAISASEGRVLVCETIGILQPMLGDYGYLEALQRAFGRTGGADCRENACVWNFI